MNRGRTTTRQTRMKAITVLLCDDHTAVREGLRILLESAEDLRVVGEAEDGRRAVRETKRLLPDVVLLDLSMPVLNGVEAARQIAREVPSAKVDPLSAHAEQHAVEAGAAGYLTKGACANDLLQAIQEISNVMNERHIHGTAGLTSDAVSNGFVEPTMRPNWSSHISAARPGRCKAPACGSR